MSSKKNLRIKSFLVNTVAAVVASLSIPASAVVLDSTPTVSTQVVSQALTDRLIIKLNESSAQFSTMSANTAGVMSTRAKRGMKELRRMYDGSYVMKLDKKVSEAEMDTIISDLMVDSSVESVVVDRVWKPLFTPNDSLYDEQWHYFEPTGGLNLPDAWDITNGSGVVVAVLDTGYRPHIDLAANIVGGYDMIADVTTAGDGNGRDSDARDPGDACGGSSSSWHGTHVAGTVAAVTNNGEGVSGVAFGAKVLPVRVLGACGGFTSDIADGMIWAAGGNVNGVPTNTNPAQVLNLSLGGSGACDSVSQAAINAARALGATVVVAAGNSTVNASNATPANCNGVVAVAATNRSGGRASYSNFGNVVDVAAPGGGAGGSVLSTLNTGTSSPGSDTYVGYQGTSMATPHVAGVAALLYSVDSGITPDEVESILKNTARSFPNTCSSCGTGIVDATAALEAVVDGPIVPPTPDDNELSNGVVVSSISGAQNSQTFYTLTVPAGASDLSFNIAGGSGDADLYVRFGSAPTTAAFDCRPFVNGNSENCSFDSPEAGTYHVMIVGFSSYSGLSLEGSYEGTSGSVGTTIIEEQNLSGTRNTWQYFTLDVAAGSSLLNAAISGGTGDADVYVRFGSEPTLNNFSCRPFVNGNNENCSIQNPAAGTWYIGVHAFSTFTGLNLEAEVN